MTERKITHWVLVISINYEEPRRLKELTNLIQNAMKLKEGGDFETYG